MRVPQVMHDEAVSDAVSVMNQLTLGLGWLNGSLAIRPQIGWHIGRCMISAFYSWSTISELIVVIECVCLFMSLLFICLLLCAFPNQIHSDTRHSHLTSTPTWNIKLSC